MIPKFGEFLIENMYDEDIDKTVPIILEIIALDMFENVRSLKYVTDLITEILNSFESNSNINARLLLNSFPDVFEKVWDDNYCDYNYTLTKNGMIMIEDTLLIENENETNVKSKIKEHFKKHWKKYAAGTGAVALGTTLTLGAKYNQRYNKARQDKNLSKSVDAIQHDDWGKATKYSKKSLLHGNRLKNNN